MSLFERIQNKRYDLQEAPIDDKGRITPEPGDIKKEKKIVKKFNKQQKKIEQKNIKTNTQKGDKLLQDLSQRRTSQDNQQQKFNRQYDIDGGYGDSGGSEDGLRKGSSQTSGSKTVNQADVSKKAQEFTKEIEKKRVKKLAPIDLKKPTERVDLRKVERKISRKRPSNAPSLADIQKKIDVKNPVVDGKPVKGTVLKVDKGEFKRVRKTKVSAPGGLNPEAQKIIKKQVSADELLGNQNKIEKEIVKNNKKIKTPKTNLFTRAKSALKGFHNYMVKDAGFRKTASKNLTRNTFKNTLRGNTLRNINKVLPGKYKALAALATGAYLATRPKKDAAGAGGTGKIKRYDAVNIPLGFNTGKRKGEK